jgi:hypothetical protein
MPTIFRCAQPLRQAATATLAMFFLVAPQLDAQQPTAAQASAIKQACRSDYMAHCAGVPTGGSAALACLKQNAAQTSPSCQQALRAVSGNTAPSASSKPAAAPASASVAKPAAPRASGSISLEGNWPHTVATENGSATVYQPQVISWPERQTLNTRMVIGIMRRDAKAPILGTMEVAFATSADLSTRWVTLYNARLLSTHFPSLDTAEAGVIEGRIKEALAGIGDKRVPLDTILLSLRQEAEKPPEVAVKNDPPVIFVSARPASLLVFDGEPVLAPIAGTSLSFAVNTNWDVFKDTASNAWYWLNNGAWYTASDIKSGWTPVAKLPPAFSGLPGDANFADVKKAMPGRPIAAKDVPTLFVSTTPAEIIVTAGAPQYQPIPGTVLQYVANTDAALFRDTLSARFYYLVSGRWFAAQSLDGPWTYATPYLPADFARIPANGPRGFVLVSVPGTPQAQEALLQAQIPQQATLSKDSAKIEVIYSGAPKFESIAGTPMLYAVNTSFNVIQVDNVYYACYQGAWFSAPAPSGPWVLAATVPAVIYTIPPSSPLYPVTYVRIYTATPTTVTYGYTAGYTMGYVTAGVVVYGTGWYYPPVIWPGPVPIYYPYPYSYAGAAYYNPATGAWARGGAIYGPYGGVAKAGTAYNPATGAWAHGGAVYGPNGGAGAFSAYNPSTGSYAHGGAVWGPDGASGNASWYNARTGVSGTTNQNSNAYGRWGSSTVSTPNQTIHTQSQSNAQGSAGSFNSSSGAKGAGVSGAGGNRAGAVKTSGGDVYAGADGNVYKKTDSGWQKYDNGSWNSVQKPTSQNTSAAQRTGQTTQGASASQRTAPTSAPRSTTTQGSTSGTRSSAEGSRSQGFGQLDNDHEARTMGAQRQQAYGAEREGGFGARGGGGGFQRGGGGGFRR